MYVIVNVSCCFKIFFTQDIQYSACWLFLLLLVVKHFYISGYFSALLAILRNTVQASGLFGSALLDPQWFDFGLCESVSLNLVLRVFACSRALRALVPACSLTRRGGVLGC